RTSPRLMVIHRHSGRIEHKTFSQITDYLSEKDILLLNNTKVLKARLLGHRQTGGKAEALFLHRLSENEALFLLGTRGKVEKGEHFVFANGKLKLITLKKDEIGRWHVLIEGDLDSALKQFGLIPLPPYITAKRGTKETTEEDETRYQTVYAQKEGSVAAPTAGLHFSSDLLNKIEKLGVELLFVTLHISYDTFRPIKTETLNAHKMYSEYYEVSEEVMSRLLNAKKEKKRIIAVGTTTVRTIETIARNKQPAGWTDLFIYPPFEFLLTDAMLTNFHLPKSTLFVLVCAFAGTELMQAAYRKAIEEKYRFYSYGDATLII
ncbi:MAG: tRNA preQ1(34) S-adenosylmethionine ribosyltransferase-isomerase QueA, partial [Planctomycetota bacterium]|nr:tRNA preQ1(34) S-adenosylmethionine ribosyltransferase-isomerase QueA [Planctomycetota bacterium]